MPTLKFAALSLCAAALIAISQPAAQAQDAETIIRAGTLIDGTSNAPLKNQLIFIKNDRIVKVSAAPAQPPTGFNVIDLSNSTVLPASSTPTPTSSFGAKIPPKAATTPTS